MILADKITEERKKNGWSQEELANQLGVSRQAVSKWESAGAVPDLQRILQMSELFCVSTDYLLKDEMKAENITYHESTESYAEPLKKVTMENANEFLDMKRKGSKVVANATSMCIFAQYLYLLENVDFTLFFAIYLLIYSIFTPNLSQYFQFGYFFFFLFF